jgi:hypothetical protein
LAVNRPCRSDADEFQQRLESVDGGLASGGFADGNKEIMLQRLKIPLSFHGEWYASFLRSPVNAADF